MSFMIKEFLGYNVNAKARTAKEVCKTAKKKTTKETCKSTKKTKK